MTNQTTQKPLWASFSQAAEISKHAGMNGGKGISYSTIRRWAKRGYGPNGFPIVSHPNVPGQIDEKQWIKLIHGGTTNATD